MKRKPASDAETKDASESPLEAALHRVRVQLFNAMAVVDACRFASDSFIAHPEGREKPDLDYALLAAYELIDECAGKLEDIGGAHLPVPRIAWRKHKKAN